MDNNINFQHCSGGRATIRSLTPVNMGVRRSTHVELSIGIRAGERDVEQLKM